MSIRVETFEVTDTPAVIPFAERYNNVEGEVTVPTGGESVFVGGPDVDENDHGYEWEPGSVKKVCLKSGTELWAVTTSGNTVEIKFIVEES